MSPRREPSVDANAHRSGNGTQHDRNAVAMTLDPNALNAVQESSEPNLRLPNHPMRTQCSSLHALGRSNAWLFTIRTGVAIVRRRIGLNYLDVREQRLDRA